MAYLGVDEKFILKGHRYVTILNDLEGRRILEVTADRSQDSLILALKTLNQDQIVGVSAVFMDVWEPYR